jgi:hypothetical protein
MKTLKITEQTHQELTRIKGAVTQKTGKETTYDEAIQELITVWILKRQASGQ